MGKRKRIQGFSVLLQLASKLPDIFYEILKRVEDHRALCQTCRLLRSACLVTARRMFVRRALGLYTVDGAITEYPYLQNFKLKTSQALNTDFLVEPHDCPDCPYQRAGNDWWCTEGKSSLNSFVGKLVVVYGIRGIIAWEHFPEESAFMSAFGESVPLYWLTPQWISLRQQFLRSCQEAEMDVAVNVCRSLNCVLLPVWRCCMPDGTPATVFPMSVWWSVERSGMNHYSTASVSGIIVHVESWVYKETMGQAVGHSRNCILVYFDNWQGESLPYGCIRAHVPSSIPEILADHLCWMPKSKLRQPLSWRSHEIRFLASENA